MQKVNHLNKWKYYYQRFFFLNYSIAVQQHTSYCPLKVLRTRHGKVFSWKKDLFTLCQISSILRQNKYRQVDRLSHYFSFICFHLVWPQFAIDFWNIVTNKKKTRFEPRMLLSVCVIHESNYSHYNNGLIKENGRRYFFKRWCPHFCGILIQFFSDSHEYGAEFHFKKNCGKKIIKNSLKLIQNKRKQLFIWDMFQW